MTLSPEDLEVIHVLVRTEIAEVLKEMEIDPAWCQGVTHEAADRRLREMLWFVPEQSSASDPPPEDPQALLPGPMPGA